MFIKLLSGDLIELDCSTLKEIKSRLADLTDTPSLYLTLLDPDTGEVVTSPDAPTAYLYSRKHDVSASDLSGWNVSQRTSPGLVFYECALFTPIGFRRVKPALDASEFKAAVHGKSIQIQESIDDEVIGDYPLAFFMIDYLDPAFLLEYLPLLDEEHFTGTESFIFTESPTKAGDPLFHLLTNKYLDGHREQDEELLLLLFRRIIPRFHLPILKNAYRLAKYHGYDSIVHYFLTTDPECSR
jgi:hypothetical protein